jgi:hypothetical protein
MAEVITEICRDNLLFVLAHAENNTAELRHTQSLGDEIFTINTESPDIPFDNLVVEYNPAALYSEYIGIYEGVESKTISTSRRTLPQAPFHSVKIVKPSKSQSLETALDAEVIKSLISACKISFSLPFIVYNGKIIKPYDTFHLTAKRYGIENRQFSITDLTYSVRDGEIKANVSACWSSALFGAWE